MNQLVQSQAVRSLMASTPKEIESKILSSMESILNFKERLHGDFSLRSYELLDTPTPEQITKAKKLMTFAMTSMPLKDMEQELLKCMMVMVKPSKESQQDIAMRIKLIAIGLQDYPADIFMHSVKQVSKTKTFFPALAEFRMAGDWRHHKRLMLLEMVQNYKKR